MHYAQGTSSHFPASAAVHTTCVSARSLPSARPMSPPARGHTLRSPARMALGCRPAEWPEPRPRGLVRALFAALTVVVACSSAGSTASRRPAPLPEALQGIWIVPFDERLSMDLSNNSLVSVGVVTLRLQGDVATLHFPGLVEPCADGIARGLSDYSFRSRLVGRELQIRLPRTGWQTVAAWNDGRMVRTVQGESFEFRRVSVDECATQIAREFCGVGTFPVCE